ncbi:RWP-RK domain-containing protein [Dunaliella salina]|uniref:RWP-RK domain-containing protein n=1 Tax=Dunaliella salina TaxID=3046 RepID=A0ABQ7GL77_DUNSA|nr:RWP-RK domain-containing protein [Dunaliella salina]|eukprot:KAF5835368.1 RWP-RK domain-containing protein [Dunaliella salina]
MQGGGAECPDCVVVCTHAFTSHIDEAELISQLHYVSGGHHILLQRVETGQPTYQFLFPLEDALTTEYATVLYSHFLGSEFMRKDFVLKQTPSPTTLVPPAPPNPESGQQCPATVLVDPGPAAPPDCGRPPEADNNDNDHDDDDRAEHDPSETRKKTSMEHDPSETRKKTDISLQELSKYFHLTIAEASKALNLSGTSLKKICRKYGLERWPHRKVTSVNNKMARAIGPQHPS